MVESSNHFRLASSSSRSRTSLKMNVLPNLRSNNARPGESVGKFRYSSRRTVTADVRQGLTVPCLSRAVNAPYCALTSYSNLPRTFTERAKGEFTLWTGSKPRPRGIFTSSVVTLRHRCLTHGPRAVDNRWVCILSQSQRYTPVILNANNLSQLHVLPAAISISSLRCQ